jgi:alkanesulfonate monooxygenase SsuD/methylene tetrahydromethanopterin reductase-like flavin-dependent oxidoreductase (luciferase family)
MQLGRFGIWTSYRAIGNENAGEAARFIEDLGFGALWLGGSPQVPALRPLLEATERIVVATAILNVWQSDPAQVARDFAELDSAFPDRILLGIGIGHPEAQSEYTKPLSAMRAFLDGLDGRTRRLRANAAAWERSARRCSSSALRGPSVRIRISSRSLTRGRRESASGNLRCLHPSSPASSTRTPSRRARRRARTRSCTSG